MERKKKERNRAKIFTHLNFESSGVITKVDFSHDDISAKLILLCFFSGSSGTGLRRCIDLQRTAELPLDRGVAGALPRHLPLDHRLLGGALLLVGHAAGHRQTVGQLILGTVLGPRLGLW